MTFRPTLSGEWFTIARRRPLFISCCDCGLVHRVEVRVRRTGRQYAVRMRVFRERQMTATHRRQTALPFRKCRRGEGR